MNLILLTTGLLILALGIAIFWLLQDLLDGVFRFSKHIPERFSWKCYQPLGKLLDPDDFQNLRHRGVSEAKVRELGKERRKICRLSLRCLAWDFYRLHSAALKLLPDLSRADRARLAAALASLRFSFWQHSLLIEFRLARHAFGYHRTPKANLLWPFEAVQDQLRQLELLNVSAATAARRQCDFRISPSPANRVPSHATAPLPSFAILRND